MNKFISELKKYYPHEFNDNGDVYTYVGCGAKAIVKYSLTACIYTYSKEPTLHQNIFKVNEELGIIKFNDTHLWVDVGFLYPLKIDSNRFKGFKLNKRIEELKNGI